MRIPLAIVDSVFVLSARVNAPHITGNLDFVVDSGSPLSMIDGLDSRKLMVPFNTIELREEMWWGNQNFRIGKLRNASLWLKTEDEKLKILRLPYVNVSPDYIHTKEGHISMNILGLDFFRQQKAKLFIDGEKNAAWIELE